MARTNSLNVLFPADEARSLSVATAYEELSPYGEVARLEVPPGRRTTAVVSFYDLRAAARAAAALGDRCTEAPQYGERTVLLRGDEQLQAWMIQEISTVRRDTAANTYTLEFFDTRAAQRAAKQFGSRAAVAQQEERAAPAEVRGPGAPGASGPRYRNDLRLSQVNWADLASGRDTRTTLRLRFLPAKLCAEEAVRRALARAGLSEVVDCIRVFPGLGHRPGSALINAVDAAGATAVAKYFHGRQWGRSMPVAVSFAAVQGAAEVQRSFPLTSDRAEGIAAKAEPWRVETCDGSTVSEEHGVSEVSTEAGDDAELGACEGHGEAARLPAAIFA